MKRLSGLSIAGVLLLALTPVWATVIAPMAMPIRVANADVIVVGKVTALADKTEPAQLIKGDTRQMQIATVKVEETLMGKAGKEVKVGFIVPAARNPGGGVRPAILPYSIRLTAGQEAALFLKRHPNKKGVFTVLGFHDVLNKTVPDFNAKKDEIKKYAKKLANPMASLKSKDAEERFTMAAMLINRYRNPQSGDKTEPVPAAESKLLLTTLAEADWSQRPSRGFMLTPLSVFYRLGLTAKDGWTPAAGGGSVEEKAKKWLKDNAGKYRIQRYVSPKEEASTEPSADK
jgi:hypothetical protein